MESVFAYEHIFTHFPFQRWGVAEANKEFSGPPAEFVLQAIQRARNGLFVEDGGRLLHP